MEPGVRGVPDVHQRRGVLHTDGLLPEDVLRHSRLAGLELERLADCQAHGVARVHRPAVLGANRVRLADRHLRSATRVPGTSQGVHRVRVAAELVLQPVPVRHTHQAVQKGLRDDLQGDRGVARHQRHRTVPAQLQLQQPTDARQHQQPGGPVVPGQLPTPAMQLQRQAAGRQVRQGRRDAVRVADGQIPPVRVLLAPRVRVRPAIHAQRPVRVPDCRDPAEAAQTRVVHVVQRELQLISVRLVATARPPSPPPPPSPLRRTTPAARPETAAGQLMDRHQKDVAGLEPVQFPERQLRIRQHGQHERQHSGVPVQRQRQAQATAHPAVGRAGRGRTATGRAGSRQLLLRVTQQANRPVSGHHSVGGRDKRSQRWQG